MDAAADIAKVLLFAQKKNKLGANNRLDAAYLLLRSRLATEYLGVFEALESKTPASRKWSVEEALRRLGADKDPVILKLAGGLLDALVEQSSSGSSPPLGVAIRAVRARGATFDDVHAAGTGVSIQDSNFSEDLAFARIVAGSIFSGATNRPTVHLQQVSARDIQITFNEKLWTRVRNFHASAEKCSLMQQRPQAWVLPIQLHLPFMGLPLMVLYWMVRNGPHYWLYSNDKLDIAGNLVGLGSLFGVIGGMFLYGLYYALSYYLSPIIRLSVGVIGKDLVIQGGEKSPIFNYYLISFVNQDNIKGSAKVGVLAFHPFQRVCIGDVGLMLVRSGEIVDFFPSKCY